MSKLEEIQDRVKQLTPEELRAFRDWFIQYDADAWDRQIESDARTGKLDALAEQALRGHKAGKSKQLTKAKGIMKRYRNTLRALAE